MIAFGPDICGDWSRATSKEWLETNGLGSYASSTIIGVNTRRYHGLLIAAVRPPTQRTLLLSKLEETLAVGDAEYDLSCNQYPGAIYPQGYRYLREFRLDPLPTFTYEVPTPKNLTPHPPLRARRGGEQERRGSLEKERGEVPVVILEKTVAMCHGINAVIVRYRLLEAAGTASLVIRPIVNCRDHHHLMRENATFNTHIEMLGARDMIAMQPFPGVPPFSMQLPGVHFEPCGYWYRSFEYAEEAARGLDYHEDQYSPGYFSCTLDPGESNYFVASLGALDDLDPSVALEAEVTRRASVMASWVRAPEEARLLVVAADAFLVSNLTPLPPLRARRGGDSETRGDDAIPRGEVPADSSTGGIIAGYHWFEEWGRDTMISLPGLTLVTGRHDTAKRILQTYAGLCRDGLIPNRVPDLDHQPDYNTTDATLWMFWAAHKYLDYTGDREFVVTDLLPILLDVIEHHVQGTRYGIRMETDGLLRAGDAGTQLTWMDAKVGDWVVTPRHGKPVEINALWHHALKFIEDLGTIGSGTASFSLHAGPPAAEVANVFRTRFWNERVGYLNDVVDGDEAEDASLRPNQIIALSLPYPILDIKRARQVVGAVQNDLLTPYGLRTLSPRDERYRGRYLGDQWSRDGAYHQGTVWPWLLGPFITAYINTAADRDAARATARGWLDPIWRHLYDAGLGQISEIFDGDEPHNPRGCIAQAWSVAEILRAAVEDLGLAPR